MGKGFKWEEFFEGALETGVEILQKDIKDSKAGVRRAADFHVRRAERERERYNERLRKADGAITSYAALTGGDLERAASLLKGIGGVQHADTYFPMIKKAIALGTPIDQLAGFVAPPAGTPARTKQQLMEQFATLRMPQLPTDVPATGWAEVFGLGGESIEDVVAKDLALYGLPRTAQERVGTVTPAMLDETKLDPEGVLKFKIAQQKLTSEQHRSAGLVADKELNEARRRKIDKEVGLLAPQAKADLDLTNSRLASAQADTKKTEYLLKVMRQQDPIKHALFVKKQQAEILRSKAGAGQKAHIAFLLEHNKELELTLQDQEMEGRGAGFNAAQMKKEANDRVLATYAKYMGDEAKRDLFSKINPISAFNSILEGAFASENLTFEPGVGDSLARVIKGDRLTVNRAYNNSLASFQDAYGGLGVAANKFIKAQSGQLLRAEANYVKNEVQRRIEGLNTGGWPTEVKPKSKEFSAFDMGSSKGIVNLFTEVTREGKKTKVILPVNQRKEGQIYYNERLLNKGYVMPYSIWSGNGWLMPSKRK